MASWPLSEVSLFFVTAARLRRLAWFQRKQELHFVHEIQTNEKFQLGGSNLSSTGTKTP